MRQFANTGYDKHAELMASEVGAGGFDETFTTVCHI